MKTTAIALAAILSTAVYADTANGDMSDRGGNGDLFTDPTSSCIEQSTFAVLQHFYPEYSFGKPCGFVPVPPLPEFPPIAPPVIPIDPPPVGTVPEPSALWLSFASLLALWIARSIKRR